MRSSFATASPCPDLAAALTPRFRAQQGHRAAGEEEATRHYREAGWNGEELHVEVKGVSADGPEVNLTRNEVEHAREHLRPVLFVVSGIKVSYADGGGPAAGGGTARILDPRRLGDAELAALSYSCRLPAET